MTFSRVGIVVVESAIVVKLNLQSAPSFGASRFSALAISCVLATFIVRGLSPPVGRVYQGHCIPQHILIPPEPRTRRGCSTIYESLI
jgi:hypothetical protein